MELFHSKVTQIMNSSSADRMATGWVFCLPLIGGRSILWQRAWRPGCPCERATLANKLWCTKYSYNFLSITCMTLKPSDDFFFGVYLFLFFYLLCYSKLFCSNANTITFYVNVWRIRGCVVLWVCVCRECEGWEDALSAWRALLLFPELFQKRSDRGASSWSHRLCASLTKNNQSLYARLSLSRL